MNAQNVDIPQRVIEVQFSAIRKMGGYAAELEKKGKQVVHLEIGRPDFDTPEHIKQAAKDALDKGYVHYTSNYGILPLREAIAKKMKLEQDLAYDPETEIIATVGAAEAISVALQTLFEPGDGLLVPTPAFVNYLNLPKLFSLEFQHVPLREEDDFVLNPDELERAIQANTKGIVLVSPHNPTGGMIPEPVMEKIAEICVRRNLLVLTDEVYEKIVYDGNKFKTAAAFRGMQERTLIINAFSKTYSMTGWRLGYLCGPKRLVDQVIKVHQNMVTSTCSFVQHAGLAALEASQDCVSHMVNSFEQRRNFLVEALAKIGLACRPPRGAFYLFPKISHFGMGSTDFAMFLLREAGVVTVPGNAFGAGGEEYIRISYANSMENLERAVEAIRKALSNL